MILDIPLADCETLNYCERCNECTPHFRSVCQTCHVDFPVPRWQREHQERQRKARARAAWLQAMREESEAKRRAHNIRAMLLIGCIVFWGVAGGLTAWFLAR